MAIIKCPECQHPVSENAVACPSCGVKIANNIVVCPDCGAVHLKGTNPCPGCGATLPNENAPELTASTKVSSPQQPQKSNRGTILALIIVAAVLVLGVGGYMFFKSQQSSQQEEMIYNDLKENATVADYENFLETYPDSKYYLEVKDRLANLKQITADWDAISLSCSKNDFLNFLHKYPSSPFEQNCKNKLDSLDWADALRANTTEAFAHYLSQHPEGIYSSEAIGKKSSSASLVVSGEEKTMVRELYSYFFKALNSQDEEQLCGGITPIMTDFFGKKGASKSDVITFMSKLVKTDGTIISFSSNDDYKITKQAIDNNDYILLVSFTVDQKTSNPEVGTSSIDSYTATSKVTSSLKISEITMKKIS